MSFKIIPLSLILIILETSYATAQLSNNPWQKPNSKETIAKIYNQQYDYYSPEEYIPEDTEIILPPPPSQENSNQAYSKDLFPSNNQPKEGFTQKIKNMFASTPKKEAPSASFSDTTSYSDKLDETFNKTKRSLSEKFHMPRINSHQIIRKIEKNSGINFKALGKKLNK